MLSTLMHTECQDVLELDSEDVYTRGGVDYYPDDYISSECPWTYRYLRESRKASSCDAWVFGWRWRSW